MFVEYQNSDDDSCKESLINEKQNEHESKHEPVSTIPNVCILFMQC